MNEKSEPFLPKIEKSSLLRNSFGSSYPSTFESDFQKPQQAQYENNHNTSYLSEELSNAS